jgi:hypothetical protein
MLSLVAGLLSGPPASAAAPAHVQSTAKQITSGTVNSVPFPGPNAAGNLIVVFVLWSNTGTVTVTDARNTLVPVAPATRFSGNQWSSQVFYAKNIGAGANTVTATFATAITSWAIVYVHEYSGVDTANPLLGASSATGSGAAMDSGPVSVASGTALLFGGGASNSTVTSAGPGFTTRSTLSGDRTMDTVVSAGAAHRATATHNGTVWVLHAVAFKAAGDGQPGDTVPPVRANGGPAGTLPAGTSSATLSVTTSEAATCRYSSTPGTGYAAMPATFSTTGATTHSSTVTGLANGQTYRYYVRCQDQAGNANTDDFTITFSVAAAAPPTGFTYEKVTVDPVAENEPWMKAIGDLNGDGVADLIVSGSHGRIVWYQTPSWTERVIAQTASSQSGSAAADIDLDGDIDVVVGATWYENVSNASVWTARPLYGGNPGMTHDIVIADVNGDGRPDISMRGEYNSLVDVFLQGAAASFTKFTLDPGLGLNGLDVADVNGDGRRDIVVGGRWMENPGGAIGSAAWPVRTFGQFPGYAAVKVVNINGGPADIVLSASEENGRLSWFEQKTNGTWSEHVIESNLSSVHGFVPADLDRDGLLDLVTSEYRGQGRLTIYRQQRDSSGVISWQTTTLGVDQLHNIQAADLNGDCKLDFFGAYALSATTPVIAYRSTGPSAC